MLGKPPREATAASPPQRYPRPRQQRSQQRYAPAASDKLAPKRSATPPAAPQHSLPDTRIFDEEISSSSPLRLAKVHSITSSARASSVSGTMRPSAFAALR